MMSRAGIALGRRPAQGLRRLAGARGLDLEVPAGSLTAVLGPSGCGKTTLLRLIAGFERADGGTIRARRAGALRRPHPRSRPSGATIGFVPQEGALFPHLDVAANVGFGLPRAQRRGGTRRGAAGAGRPRRPRQSAARTSSPAASSSASRWRARWRPAPRPGPARRALRRARRRPARAGARRGPRGAAREPAPPRCSSPTTRRRRCRSPTPSPSCATARSSRPPTRRRSTATRSTPSVAGFVGEAVLLRGRAATTATPRPRSGGCRPAAPTASDGDERERDAAPRADPLPRAGAAGARRAGACSRPRSTVTTRPPGSRSRTRRVRRSSPAPPATCCRRSATRSRSPSRARRWPFRALRRRRLTAHACARRSRP